MCNDFSMSCLDYSLAMWCTCVDMQWFWADLYISATCDGFVFSLGRSWIMLQLHGVLPAAPSSKSLKTDQGL